MFTEEKKRGGFRFNPRDDRAHSNRKSGKLKEKERGRLCHRRMPGNGENPPYPPRKKKAQPALKPDGQDKYRGPSWLRKKGFSEQRRKELRGDNTKNRGHPEKLTSFNRQKATQHMSAKEEEKRNQEPMETLPHEKKTGRRRRKRKKEGLEKLFGKPGP